MDELEVGAGPLSAKAKGTNTVHVLLAIAVAAWCWYLFYNHEAKADEKARAQVIVSEKVAEAVTKQTQAIERVERTQKAVIYVLTLSEAERKKLNLVRPEVLYEMQRHEYNR